MLAGCYLLNSSKGRASCFACSEALQTYAVAEQLMLIRNLCTPARNEQHASCADWTAPSQLLAPPRPYIEQ